MAIVVLSGCASTADSEPASVSDNPSPAPAGANSGGQFSPIYSSAFDDPWPTDITRDELVETALFRLFSDLDELQREECAIRPVIFTSDPLLPEHEYLIKEISTGMINSYCDYLTQDITVVAGSYDYLKQVMAEEELPGDEFGGNCGFNLQQDYASACAGWGVAWTGISLGSKRNGEAFIEERRLTIAAHELFHIVHDQINPEGDPGLGSCRTYDCTGPVWFFEGAGEFMGRAMTQYLGLQNYATFVPTDRSGLYMDAKYLSDLEFLTDWGNRAGSTENYYSGQIAIEYMIANRGLYNVLKIWELMAEGEYFPNAFSQTMGLSLEQFYDKFEAVHTKFYEEGGYCDSKLGCSVWNEPNTREPWFNEDGSARNRSNFDHNHSDGSKNGGHSSEDQHFEADDCYRENSAWWLECQGIPYPLPVNPENSDHGFPTEYERIPKVFECSALEKLYGEIPGFAATREARESTGAASAHISTQYYAMLAAIDLNRDGVVCSDQVPEP